MSENFLKQIPKELWWKIFFMLFKDLNEKNNNKENNKKEIDTQLAPYTPYEFPCRQINSIRDAIEDTKSNVKMERSRLLNAISNTCAYWEDITIRNKTFTHLFFEQHTQEFDGVKLVHNKDKFLNVNHKMKLDELNMKIEEITSFRNNDERCIIKQQKYETIKSDLNPKLNSHNNVILINNDGNNNDFVHQVQNIYAGEAEGIDIESVEERYREKSNIYEKMLEEDEQCKERQTFKEQTDTEYKEQEDLQKKEQLIPLTEFEDKMNLLMEEREQSLFKGFIDNTVTYYNTQGSEAFL